MEKPFSQACENNKRAILEVIEPYFTSGVILEIGSGTGQHAVYFADHLPKIYWQTSDQKQYLEGINLWLNEYRKYNLGRPLTLDVNQSHWPLEKVDGIFTANTTHIMHWDSVCAMFHKNGDILLPGHYFCMYGPINIHGEFTADSNQAFDQQLREQDPEMGIRDIDDLRQLAQESNLEYVTRHPMPANNFTTVWRRSDS